MSSSAASNNASTATATATSTATPSTIRTTTSWEPQMAELLYSKMLERRQMESKEEELKQIPSSPFMVGLVGIPGAGKTTSAHILSELLQFHFNSDTDRIENTNGKEIQRFKNQYGSERNIMVLPMDGYHLPLSQLKAKPNANDLVYRRGAPDTFDPMALLSDLKRIKHGGDAGETGSNIANSNNNNNNSGCGSDKNDFITVQIPGFDHAIGDPQPNAYTFHRNQHSIIICEGLYLLHQDESIGWSIEIEKQFDVTIYINADVDTCVQRLKIRNKCIPGYTPEEIDRRCDIVDRSNAMLVLGQSKDRAMYVVDSVVA